MYAQRIHHETPSEYTTHFFITVVTRLIMLMLTLNQFRQGASEFHQSPTEKK